MKYIILVFILCSNLTIAQTFKQQIDEHRKEYKNNFIKESRSPLRAEDFKDLHFFEADSAFKIEAKVEMLSNQKIFNMPTYDGTSKEFIRYAKVKFKLKQDTLTLTLYKNIALATNPVYKDLLFLPFTDESNQHSTYGGGRYIDLNTQDIKSGKLTIDFNKAYNPYCAYSDGYRCPIPPEENDLAISILAGEKRYTGEKKHKK
ncbi:MAG: DUF1684 domain-containing protein [Pedobacter sp.]|nr:MAG: DUF1684 domain-containing protein [Pedobacter sp.]